MLKNVIYEHLDKVSVIYYLHIEGGQGHGNSVYGGTYKFVGTYLNPNELEGRGLISLEKWCEQNKLPYVTSDSFEGLTNQLKEFKR